MVQLTRIILRKELGHDSDITFHLSEQQTACLKELRDVLQDATSLARKRLITYHNWVWSLIYFDPAHSKEVWGDPVQRAIWLRALREDGNFYEASDFPPDLAKWKYLCNMTSLLEALLDKDEDTDSIHEDDFE
jgi:hypothetical protein